MLDKIKGRFILSLNDVPEVRKIYPQHPPMSKWVLQAEYSMTDKDGIRSYF
jgi:hypothetical protein